MALTLGRSVKPQKLTRRNIPVKRSINLSAAGEKKSNLRIGTLSVILILLCCAVFSKYGVYDRLVAMDRARAEVSAVERQIRECNRAIEDFGELADRYAHYTYSGMTQEELSRANRADVLEMIRRQVIDNNYVESWTLQGNLLTLYISGKTLQELNIVTQLLEQEELVDYCTVSTASTNEMDRLSVDAFGEVTAQLEIHLRSAEEAHW